MIFEIKFFFQARNTAMEAPKENTVTAIIASVSTATELPDMDIVTNRVPDASSDLVVTESVCAKVLFVKKSQFRPSSS